MSGLDAALAAAILLILIITLIRELAPPAAAIDDAIGRLLGDGSGAIAARWHGSSPRSSCCPAS